MINKSFIAGILVCSVTLGVGSAAAPRLQGGACASGVPVAAAFDNGSDLIRVLRCDGTQWFCSLAQGRWYQLTHPTPQLPANVVVEDIVLWTGQTILTRDGHGWIWNLETTAWVDLGLMPEPTVATDKASWSTLKQSFK